MIQNLASLSSPPPSLSGDHLKSVRAGCEQVERRCPGIKCWIDVSRQLVVFGPARMEGSTLFSYAVPLFKAAEGRLNPLGFKDADSVDNVVNKLNSAKMPAHLKDRLARQAEETEKKETEKRLEKALEDRRPEAEKMERWIKENLITESKYRKFMGV